MDMINPDEEINSPYKQQKTANYTETDLTHKEYIPTDNTHTSDHKIESNYEYHTQTHDQISPNSVGSKYLSRDGTVYVESVGNEEIMGTSICSLSPVDTPKDMFAPSTYTTATTLSDAHRNMNTITKQEYYKFDENSDQYGLVNYHCDICSKDITLACRIKCAECDDFDLCVDCFSKGAEIELKSGKKHLKSHRYIPIGRSSFPLYKADWSADEEIMLLEGVSKHGLGNWKEVAFLVNSVATKPKQSFMCERHYYDIYLNSRTSPLPDPSKLLTSADGGPILLSEDANSVDDDRPDSNSVKTQTQRTTSNKPTHQVVGYWPLRGDFDIEFDNEAELILADMEFKEGDTAQEKELKLQTIEIYNSKLDERIYRKQTVIEKGLLDIKALQQKEKKRTKEERELHTLLRPLARFHSEQEHERFIQLLIEEKHIELRLLKLQEWKSLGLKTLQEVHIYEEEKKRREDIKTRGILYPGIFDASNKTHHRRSRGRSDESHTPSFDPYKHTPTHILPRTPLNDTHMGQELLDSQEKRFCESMNLPPSYYIFTKHLLLHEAAKNPQLNQQNMNNPIRIDAIKSGQLYDFFLNLDFPFNRSTSPNENPSNNPHFQTTKNSNYTHTYNESSHTSNASSDDLASDVTGSSTNPKIKGESY